jgi:hypothetical protein
LLFVLALLEALDAHFGVISELNTQLLVGLDESIVLEIHGVEVVEEEIVLTRQFEGDLGEVAWFPLHQLHVYV